MRPTMRPNAPASSRLGSVTMRPTNALAARLGPVRAPFVRNGRPAAANVPRVLGPRGRNVNANNAENAQNAPVHEQENDQRTTLTGAGTWEYQSPAFDPEGQVRFSDLIDYLLMKNPLDDSSI